MIGNDDKTIARCLALLTETGKKLSTIHDWQAIQREQTFTSDGTGSYTRASVFTDGDFLRYINDTDWDRTDYRKMQLVTAQEWQAIKSSVNGDIGNVRFYREQQNSILITPDESGDTLVFNYISNNWITDSTGVTLKSSFTSDDDLTVFPEFLMELALKYELKASKGLPSAIELEAYERYRDDLIATETPRRNLKPHYGKEYFAYKLPIGQ